MSRRQALSVLGGGFAAAVASQPILAILRDTPSAAAQIIVGDCPGQAAECSDLCSPVTGYLDLLTCGITLQGASTTYNGCGPASPGFLHDNGQFGPKVNITPCCNNHDCCYGNCGIDKLECDDTFLVCMQNLCDQGYPDNFLRHHQCMSEARLFYEAVLSPVGDFAYEAAQKEVCYCCECPQCQKKCDGTCTDIQNDPNNCGDCGVVCPPGETCVRGKCGCGGQTCAAGATCCNGTCVDTQTDPGNCGTCGHACPAGESCVAGKCGCGEASCGPSSTCCVISGVPTCVNTQTDPDNCGACGNECPAGEDCVAGACGCGGTSCGPPNSCCVVNGVATCTDIQNDPDNCGGCGTVCPAGQTCANGACSGGDCTGVTCPPEYSCCDGVCMAQFCDNGNCSFCGGTCPAGMTCCQCESAICSVFPCCSDLQTDSINCGKCGNECGGLTECCVGGECVSCH